ncbi:MAG TPA: twin-arginine translocase subunit TatC [Abditibacteriaceae bacterium]|jgi:sec-independent protein translocase protein TatC
MSIENTPESHSNAAPHSPAAENENPSQEWIGPPDSMPLDEMALDDARPLFVPDTPPPGAVARSTALPHVPLSDASPGEYLMNEYSNDVYSDNDTAASEVALDTTRGDSSAPGATQVPELEPLSSGYAGGGFDDPPTNGHITARRSDYAPEPAPNADPRDQEQDLFAHLAELRTRLLRCIAAVTIGMMVMWSLRDRLLQFFAEPIVRSLREHGGIPTTTSPAEGFSIYMQTVFTASLLVVLPYVLWQVWAFVEPALTHQERRYSSVLVPFSVILFFSGAALGFYMSPMFFEFFLQFQPPGTAALWSYANAATFLAKMLLVFGVSFQVPVVAIFVHKIGLVSRNVMIDYWRHVVVFIFILVAVITPTWDPFTLGAAAAPPCVLYVLSIWLVKWL